MDDNLKLHPPACAAFEKALVKCIAAAPKRGCIEIEARALECVGHRLTPLETKPWHACYASVMSVGVYQGATSCAAQRAALVTALRRLRTWPDAPA